MRKENTTNTKKATQTKANATKQTKASTMITKKRAMHLIDYDENNNAKLVSVAKENETHYQLSNNKKIEKSKAVANISKNRFNVYDDKKSYQSHIESFKDVHDLRMTVSTLFEDARETQYFVFCNDDKIKLRIQATTVEIMCAKLKDLSNALVCDNRKDELIYFKFLNTTTRENVINILIALKENDVEYLKSIVCIEKKKK